MSVYYKSKSEKTYRSITLVDRFISISSLKEIIFEQRYVTNGTDIDLEITNSQTNEVYLDDAMLIPKNTAVLVRRVPGYRRMRFVPHQYKSKVESKPVDQVPVKSNTTLSSVSTVKDVSPLELDDGFGEDIYTEPCPVVQPKNAVLIDREEEERRIKALVETPVLSWPIRADHDKGFGTGGRIMSGRDFGRAGFTWQRPPEGYVCHRCNKPGHLIQHCPTNGDPEYDIKKFKAPTGIPKTMLVASSDGSYVLPDGGVATVKPDESTFEKEIERIPTAHSRREDLPPELYCLLCKDVMKDAVLTTKCCFNSFCDKCIRDYIISKSSCVCGAKAILADDLIPNKTIRDTITRILEGSLSSSNNTTGSGSQHQDMASAKSRQSKSSSPTQSAVSKGADLLLLPAQQAPASDESKTTKVPDISESTSESTGAVESVKKKKKARLPGTETSQHLAAQSFMMPNCQYTNGYNPYWTGSFGYGMPYGMGYGSPPISYAVPNAPYMAPPQMDVVSFRSNMNGYEQECVTNKQRMISSDSKTQVNYKSSNEYSHLKRKRSAGCQPSVVHREQAVQYLV